MPFVLYKLFLLYIVIKSLSSVFDCVFNCSTYKNYISYFAVFLSFMYLRFYIT